MPRPCSICTHSARDAIDRALVESTPKRRVAAHFAVTEQAVRRHAARHLPGMLVRSADAAEVARADDLLGLARRLQAEALEVMERAKADGNLGGVLQAIDRLQKGVVMLSGLVESIGPGAQPQRVSDEAFESARARLESLIHREYERGRKDALAELSAGGNRVAEHSPRQVFEEMITLWSEEPG